MKLNLIQRLSIAFVIAGALCGIVLTVQAALDSLTIGAFTIDATGAPATTVKPPTRSGTLAVTADIPVTPPGANVIAGAATLTGGTVLVTFPAQPAPPICVAIDTTATSAVSRSAVTVSSVTFEGVRNHAIEYICTAKNN